MINQRGKKKLLVEMDPLYLNVQTLEIFSIYRNVSPCEVCYCNSLIQKIKNIWLTVGTLAADKLEYCLLTIHR